MSTRGVSGSARCPAEGAIEGWAIQDVMGKTGVRKRAHLEGCPFCHDLHRRFVSFYHELNQQALKLLVTRGTRTAKRLSSEEERFRPIIRAMRPLDQAEGYNGGSTAIAFSHTLISERWAKEARDKPFVSSDGTVIGRFLTRGSGSKWTFQLLSPDDRFVYRALIHLPEDDSFFQSDDSGATSLFGWSGALREIRLVEVVPFSDESVYSLQSSEGGELITNSVELDGGAVGKIVVEQEEGDEKESVLHIELAGLPRPLLSRRVIVAIAVGRDLRLVEEAVGRDVYFYGPDLFRDFRLWVYIR